MHILVIDGQGGGLGAALVTRLKARLGNAVQIWAVGTNSHATSVMLKAGADRAATGFYYSKAKAENRIKLRKMYGAEIYNDAKEP